MNLLWPGFLFLLIIVPVLVAVYIWMLRRRRKFALRYSSLSLVRAALPQQPRWRRHLPFVLFVLAIASLVMALVRPAAVVTMPTDQVTIILCIDVSLSMRAADIEPSRLEAAQAAALSFIRRQKSTTMIGIVAFSAYAVEVQSPTTDQTALEMAVESLTLGRRTAIGSGILQSIDAVAEADPNVMPSTVDGDPNAVKPTPVLPGMYAPDIIVVLTDGVSNFGPQPLRAALQAVDRGIRIYTIGYGTDNGNIPFGGPNSPDPNGFGGFGGGQRGGPGGGGPQGGGGGIRVSIDETTLKEVAAMTGGTYYSATSASEIEQVFERLPTYLISKHGLSEISIWFAAAGGLLVAAAITLAQLWHPMP